MGPLDLLDSSPPDLCGAETLTGTLKRSQSVGVSRSAAGGFDRQLPARQSFAGDLERRIPGDVTGGGVERSYRSLAERSFIPKPSKPGKLVDIQR